MYDKAIKFICKHQEDRGLLEFVDDVIYNADIYPNADLADIMYAYLSQYYQTELDSTKGLVDSFVLFIKDNRERDSVR